MSKDGQVAAYTYNGLNQLTEAETASAIVSYAYDGRGNQISETNETDSISTAYTYAVTGEMTGLEVSSSGTVTYTQENEYNHEGIRISKTEGSVTRRYYYDNGIVAYTKDGTSLSSSNILSAEGDVLGTYRDSAYYTFTKDTQNSTESIVKSDGTLAAAYTYTDFGETAELTGSSFDNEICYTGAVYDAESGLYYMNARYYDPENGRFISQDSYRGELDELDQWHLYAYCANNPINYADSSGHFRVANWLASSILDAGLSLLVGVAAPGLSPVKSILNKLMKSSKTKNALKKFYNNNKDKFLNGFVQMIDFTKSKKFLNKIVEKARDWFSKKKAKKWKKGLLTVADSIGTGYVDDFFWKLSVGKTAFGGISAGFSFGSLIVSAIDFYQHSKSFEDHINIGNRKCYC